MQNNRSNIPSISPAAVVVAAVFLLVSVIGINWFTTFVPRKCCRLKHQPNPRASTSFSIF